MEKKRTFQRVLLIYVGIWIIATIVLCVKLWDVFADYQNDYEIAEAEANPDLYMEDMIKLYEKDQIMNTAGLAYEEQFSEYEKNENKQAWIQNLTDNKKLIYKRSEEFTERKPSYDILANNEKIGSVILKQQKETDVHGFHKYELDNAQVIYEVPELETIRIQALESEKILVNGKEISAKDRIKSEDTRSAIAGEAMAISEVSYDIVNYELGGFIESPCVQKVKNGQKAEIKEEEGTYIAYKCADDAFVDAMSEQILQAGEVYIKNTNQLASFAEVSKYLQVGSTAYQTVQSVQSGLLWAGKPEKLEIQESDITDFVQYGDNVFTVKTKYKIFRLYRDISYEEEMNYEWLYIKNGNQWKIINFSLANT